MTAFAESNGSYVAVLMGMDAFRICIGMRPKNYPARAVMRWLTAMVSA